MLRGCGFGWIGYEIFFSYCSRCFYAVIAGTVEAFVGVEPFTTGVVPVLCLLCRFNETGTSVELVGVDVVIGSLSLYCC